MTFFNQNFSSVSEVYNYNVSIANEDQIEMRPIESMFEEESSHFNNVLIEENHYENEQQPNNEQKTNDEWIEI